MKLRFYVFLFYSLLIGVIISLVLMVFSLRSSLDSSSLWDDLLLWIVGLGVVSAALELVYEYKEREHLLVRHIANREKAATYAGPAFLLLRSFWRQQLYLHEEKVRVYLRGMVGEVTRRSSFVRGLLKAIQEEGMGVTLKTPEAVLSFPRGHGMVVVESPIDLWWHNFTLLATTCKAIFAIPEITPGSVKEIVFLRKNNLFRKTIFIMAPTLPNYSTNLPFPPEKSTTRMDRWESIRRSLESQEVYLPRYRPDGAMFILDTDSTIVTETNLENSEEPQIISRAFHKTIYHVEGESLPLKDILPQILFSRDADKRCGVRGAMFGYTKDIPMMLKAFLACSFFTILFLLVAYLSENLIFILIAFSSIFTFHLLYINDEFGKSYVD